MPWPRGGTTLKTATVVKLVILAVILVFAVLSSRAFCKTMCPIGALLAPLNYLCFWVVKPPHADCIACSSCDRACPTGIEPSLRLGAGRPPSRALDCILCHDCQHVCPGFARDRKAKK